MGGVDVAGLGQLELVVPEDGRGLGTRVLDSMIALAEGAIGGLRRLQGTERQGVPAALLGRLRGTGRGISFGGLIAELEREHPLTLAYPFEGSDRVGGAYWSADRILGRQTGAALAKLRWDSRATDLPMHVHDNSDRFIIVLDGRGMFHVTDESADGFTGMRVRSVPARPRDVFLFSRGTVHTFSTEASPMTLLSCQLPFLDFDDPAQYRLPAIRWIARDRSDDYGVRVACDPAWSIIAYGGRRAG